MFEPAASNPLAIRSSRSRARSTPSGLLHLIRTWASRGSLGMLRRVLGDGSVFDPGGSRPGGFRQVATVRRGLAEVRTLRGRGRPRHLQRPYRPRWRRRPPRPRRPDHHEGLGRADGQQRLSPGVHARPDEALLIDAANEPDRLAELVGLGRRRPAAHHGHHAPPLRPLAGPRRGGRGVPAPARSRTRSTPPSCRCPSTTRSSTATPCASVGSVPLEVIHLRGHTPGSIALVYRGRAGSHLFTGDSLFPGGPGKTRCPHDFASLMDDLEERVFGDAARTRRGSIPATATTPRSARSARTSPSGASAAGDVVGAPRSSTPWHARRTMTV